MLAVGGLPVFNVVVVKFYINCMVAINRCMIVLVLILIYTSLTVNYSYLRIIRLTKIILNSLPLISILITLHRRTTAAPLPHRVTLVTHDRWFTLFNDVY